VFAACYRLKLDIEVASVSLTILQKYMNSESMSDMTKEEAQLVVTTCIFLASKTEENPRRLRDVINVTHKLTWVNETSNNNSSGGNTPLDTDDDGGTMNLDNEYLLMKERVVHMEQKLLRCIGFDLEIGHPFCFLLHFSKYLHLPQHVVHKAWTILVDSLWLPESSTTEHHVLASAAIYMALLDCSEPYALKRPWMLSRCDKDGGQESTVTGTVVDDDSVISSVAWWHDFGVKDEELTSTCELMIKNPYMATIS
jgi:cyclin L